jgi:hypothetical protein
MLRGIWSAGSWKREDLEGESKDEEGCEKCVAERHGGDDGDEDMMR